MIGIVGFGRFGRLMARYLSLDRDVLVYNRTDRREEIVAAGAGCGTLEEVCRQPVVIVSVAISALESTLHTIAPLLKEGALVMDVASVKTLPVQWMERILPEHVSILATHPMFGPDSAQDSLSGRKIVLCPCRVESDCYRKVKDYLSAKDLVIIESTPEEHDRQAAVSLCLTHFIGRSLAEFGAGPLEIDTEGYKRLLHILGVVGKDTWQLFLDMQHYNPYAAEYRESFLKTMESISSKIDGM